VAQVHAINTLLNRVKGSKLSSCLHVIVCVALRCPGELTDKAKDLTLKAKNSKFVLEDISRPRTPTLPFVTL